MPSLPKGPRRLRRIGAADRLHVTEHLHELRQRLLVSVAALVVAFAGAYVFRDALLSALTLPLPPGKRTLVTLSPTEPFLTTMKVCFWAAILAAMPVWLYQLYAFCIPAVGRQSRRVMLAVVGGAATLFLGGVAFGYYLVLGVALRFLLSFGGDAFVVQLRAGEYFSFATTMLLAAGLVFELPAAMLAFARLGIVSAADYVRQWRIAIVGIAAVAAVLPGGDPISMILLMVPQVVLYGLGVWLARVFGAPTTRNADRIETSLAGGPLS